MNALIVLTALMACASAQYLGYAGYGYAGYPYAHPAYSPYGYASQYHSQDLYGHAAYGFAAPHQAKHEVRDHAGNVAGSYSYVDAEGKLIKATYTAGVDGFKIHSNNLPVAPVADLELPVAPVYTGVAPVDTGVAPEPVQDTPEVAAAKAAHLELLAAANAADEPAERKKRSTTAVAPLAVAHGFPYHGFGYSFGYPAYGYAHHGYGYAAPHAYAAPVYAHVAAPVPAVARAATYAAPAVVGREATLTRVILNPGHAESYRVD